MRDPEPESRSESTVDSLVREARKRLERAAFSPSPREARLLLGRVLGWSEARLLARGEEAVPPAAEARFRQLLERRLTGEPVAYLLGEKEFYGRPFRVDGRVLVPRPETEHLVEMALEAPLPPRPRVLDVGTGSGCLAVTLALELRRARVTATDVSLGALAVAAANARHLGAEVSFVAADLATGLDPTSFDLVVSNPPYLGREEAGELSPEVVEFEPHRALFAEGSGESVVSRLLDLGRSLHENAALMMEIGHRQRDRVLALAARGPWEVVEVRQDYAGVPRTVHLVRRGAPNREPEPRQPESQQPER